MRSIEQKLKVDAQAFEIKFDSVLHDKIMTKLEFKSRNSNNKTTLFSSRKFILSGFAMTLLGLLIFSITDTSTSFNKEKPTHHSKNINVVNIDSDYILIDKVAINLDKKMTNPILNEQQALIDDINHIKELMFLN